VTTSPTIRDATGCVSHAGLFASLIESCPDGIIAQTLDGVVTAWNPAVRHQRF